MSKVQKDGGADGSRWIVLGTAFVTACTAIWLSKVSEIVPEPYLDEIFHVRQAQVYCNGNFHVWDPKITTPPGLYFVSWIIFRLTGKCSITTLRGLNVGTLMVAPYLTYRILLSLFPEADYKGKSRWCALSAANIWLFPPLFFFSALYYTDIQSTLWVLLAFQAYQRYEKDRFQGFSEAISLIRFGVIALTFRQTNIFWVAVFPAGLGLVSVLKQSAPKAIYIHTLGFWDMCQASWYESALYDPPIEDALIEDYVKTVVSIAIVAVSNLSKLIRPLVPCVFLLAVFGGFIFWNGGVVLGDKSNHVATIHLPQMLYLWPYMLFFSFPIVVPSLVDRAMKLVTQKFNPSSIIRQLLAFALATVLAAGAVRFNTIVHPFTLADNRHYVFYVFRILLRHPATRYLAAPAYVICANIAIQALGGRKAERKPAKKSEKKPVRDNLETANTTSFAIIWIATTTLSLVTAPLFEPRYCIVPWIMWRLHAPRREKEPEAEVDDGRNRLLRSLGRDETSLVAETVWFCCINAVTGYIFLHWGFKWPQEEGKVQRFMW